MILMEFSALKQPCWRWVFLLVFSLLFSSSFSDPRAINPALFCGNSPPPNGINFVPVFTELMRGLAEIINTSHFASYNFSSASTPQMFALAQCHQDLSQTDCLQCYAISRTRIPRCLPSLTARIFLDGCFLRYDNYSFFQEPVSSTFDNVTCGPNNATVSGEDRNRRASLFSRNVDYAVGNVTSIALRNGGFGTVGMNGVYALAQCWQSVPTQGCRQCLQKAATAVRGCAPKEEGRGMNSGCYLRYSTTKFYNEGGNTGNDQGKVFAIFDDSELS